MLSSYCSPPGEEPESASANAARSGGGSTESGSPSTESVGTDSTPPQRGSKKIHLRTAPHLAPGAGVLYIKSMWEQARAACPDAEAMLWVDCGDDPALVMAGLREGLTHFVFSGPEETFQKLAGMASQQEATLIRPEAIAKTAKVG